MTQTDATNPYVGLRPFDIDESILFFGRNDQTVELLQRLHEHHFVAVVGSSGSGKSSLLRAGLIPALKAGYLVDDSDQWLIAIMKPGQAPLHNLAASLLLQMNPSTTADAISKMIQKISEEGADAILDMLLAFRKETNIHFFLLVDQFEELFRFAMDLQNTAKKDVAIDFVNIMLELSQNSRCPVYVVTTMRSDFIGDCADFNGLPEAMNESQYLVPKLNRLQLKSVIEGPAKLFGEKVNPALTSTLLNDLGKVKDELPLLQHALMRIWDFEMNVNKSGELDMEDYTSIGGLEKALSIHADEALQGMDDNDLKLTRQIFQSLTAIDENGRKVRRPVLLSELEKVTGATNEIIIGIIDRFIDDKRCFLVVNDIANSGDQLIDISHESLIRQWVTLSQWVDQESEAASFFSELAKSAALHQLNKKDYLTGNELRIAMDWYGSFKPKTEWAHRYAPNPDRVFNYLFKSITEQKRQRQQKNIRTVMAIMVVLAIILATMFIVNRYNQNSNLRKLLSGLLQKRKTAIEHEDNLQALIYSAEYLSRETGQAERDSIIESCIKTPDLLPTYVLRNMTVNADEVKIASLSPDGKTIYAWLQNGTLCELNSETGTLIKSVNYQPIADTETSQVVRKIKLSLIDTVNKAPQTIHIVFRDSSLYFARQFEILMGSNSSGFPNLPKVIRSLHGAAYSNDKQQILTWGENTESIYDGVNVWDSEGVATSVTLIHDGINGAAASNDHSVILTWGTDSTVRIWQKIFDTTDIRHLSPRFFNFAIRLATGVEMNPSDYSIKIIPSKEYLKRQATFLQEQKASRIKTDL